MTKHREPLGWWNHAPHLSSFLAGSPRVTAKTRKIFASLYYRLDSILYTGYQPRLLEFRVGTVPLATSASQWI